jgi:NAD(P)H-dependent flavin oxidoreductase YrpB (nitropropane dioxygenase family)
VSFALGDPGDLVERVHAAGAMVIQQVHTVTQAREPAGRGVDVVIAQGSEAGGRLEVRPRNAESPANAGFPESG